MWRWYCADGSVLPLAYGEVGYADGSFDGSKFIDAQGKPSHVKSVRIAEVKFGSCSNFTFDFDGQTAERWLAPTDQWGRQHVLVRNPKQIPVHFKRNSLCAVGVIRMLSADHPSSSTRAGTGDDAKHVRALTLGRTLSGLGAGWVRIGDSIYALKSNANQHVDSTMCPIDGLLWLRTTLIHLDDDTWELDEFCQNISDLSTMTVPFEANRPVTEVITIAHTATVPPEVLGFTLHDDNVVIAPRSGIPLCVLPPSCC